MTWLWLASVKDYRLNLNKTKDLTMDFELSPKAKDYVKRTKAFIQEHIEPMEADFWADVNAKQNHGDWS